ncbi:MAG: hypothetical protein ABIO48_16110 [Pedococcus sp.]
MTRLSAALVLAAGLGVVGSIEADAATQVTPAPLDTVGATAESLLPVPLPTVPPEPVTQVVGTVTDALKGAAGAGSGSGSQARTQEGTQPATSSSSPAAKTSASRAEKAPAADDDTVVAADASVRDLLGACVRLTRSGVPARTTVVVLDQNLIDQLTAVGLPLDRLLVPCPAGVANGTPVGTSGGTTRAAAVTGDPSSAGTLGPLAFTGTNLPATLLLAGGLLALGIAFLRKAHALVEVQETRTGDV